MFDIFDTEYQHTETYQAPGINVVITITLSQVLGNLYETKLTMTGSWQTRRHWAEAQRVANLALASFREDIAASPGWKRKDFLIPARYSKEWLSPHLSSE